MTFCISKEQQKTFVDHFLSQVLDVSLDLVDQGKDRGSPGETIQMVGAAVIRQILRLDAEAKPEGDEDQ